jgi:hypothetical protein
MVGGGHSKISSSTKKNVKLKRQIGSQNAGWDVYRNKPASGDTVPYIIP